MKSFIETYYKVIRHGQCNSGGYEIQGLYFQCLISLKKKIIVHDEILHLNGICHLTIFKERR